MSTCLSCAGPAHHGEETAMRFRVLEMTTAALAARLPRKDFEEIVSLLVFITKSSEATHDLASMPGSPALAPAAGEYALELLERISWSRKPQRGSGTMPPDGDRRRGSKRLS